MYMYMYVDSNEHRGYTHMYAYLVFCVICWDGGGSGNVEGGIEQTSFNLREGKWEERRQQETKGLSSRFLVHVTVKTKASHLCCTCMTCDTHTLGHPSATDEAWY